MKKFICSFIIVSLIVISTGTIFAISNNDYSIEILPEYQRSLTGHYINDNGDNIGITVSNQKVANPYTEKNLNDLEDAFINEFEAAKSQVTDELKKTYGSLISEEEISKMIDSMGIEKIMLKEISTCSKNNYKCFHIISKAKMLEQTFYSNQYMIFSDKKSFTITYTTYTEGEPNFEDFEKMLDSFTIVDYKEPAASSIDWSSVVTKGFIGAFIGALAGSTAVIAKKKKNDDTNL